MNAAGMVTEKRQAPRANTSIPVRYREVRDGAETVGVGSLTHDVSTGGLRFGTNTALSTASQLLVELDIPNQTKPVTAISRVVWTQQTNGGEQRYQVGSQFMEITEKDQELIATYLKSL